MADTGQYLGQVVRITSGTESSVLCVLLIMKRCVQFNWSIYISVHPMYILNYLCT